MKPSTILEPTPTPHRSKRFWIFVALGLVPVLAAPVVQRLLGFPLFSPETHIISGGITLAVWSICCWLVFRFGGVAFIGIGIAMIIFALWARSHG